FPRPLPSLLFHSFPTRRSSDLPISAFNVHSLWAACSSSWPPPMLRLLPFSSRLQRKLPSFSGISLSSISSRRVRTPDSLRLKTRSEEHTSELQSRFDLVCRLLL